MTDVDVDVTAWPACPQCRRSWILRRVTTVDGLVWSWRRDCKHRHDPVTVTS